MKVVNIYRARYTVFIGRGSLFGNPYTHLSLRNTQAQYHVRTREDAIVAFDKYARKRVVVDWQFKEAFLALKANDILGCYCSPKSCHGDVIVEIWEELRNES